MTSKIEDAATPTEIQLRQELIDYKNVVLRKLNSLEHDMNRLVAENERLVQARESAYVERDACLGLIAQLAAKCGLTTGVVNGNTVVVDLPSGQVSWDVEASESHLFAELPEYSNPIEEIEIMEKYRRVMNPGV